MAKQRGIHQVSGKIDNLVYYEQKRVPVGLIRRQNEAMSERLKTDPAFKITRLAGAEFGYCSNAAASIIRGLPLRAQRIIDPFVLPQFTKYLYKYLKELEGGRGNRTFEATTEFGEYVEKFINSLNKFSWSKGFPRINFPSELRNLSTEFSITIDKIEVQNFCDLYGFDGIRFSFYDDFDTTFGILISTGKYRNTTTLSPRDVQRVLIERDDAQNYTQELQITGGTAHLTGAMVMAEPMKIVAGDPTYPRSMKSFIYKFIKRTD